MGLDMRRLCNDPPGPCPSASDLSASLYPSKLTIYRRPSGKPPDPLALRRSHANLTRGVYNGYMSPAARRKFRRHVSTWLRSIFVYREHVKRRYDPGRAYPTMATLTLPVSQVHDDREINRKCFQPWLQVMRREYGVELYAWRAEAQENGNIHFHVLLDRYVPKRALQSAWNMCLDTLDYRARYFAESGSLDPPSTNIFFVQRRVKDRKTGEWRDADPVSYLLEYLTDAPQVDESSPSSGEDGQPQRRLVGFYRDAQGNRCTYVTRPISGRCWGMSDALRTIHEPRLIVSLPLLQALESAVESGEVRRTDLDHATVYTGRIFHTLSQSFPAFRLAIRDYHLQIFRHLYPGQIPSSYRWPRGQLDPVGLWLDSQDFSYTYPPTHDELVDAYTERIRPTINTVINFRTSPPTYSPVPALAYRRHRILARALRAGITSIPQRWIADLQTPTPVA